jgi:hypothetical protein
MPSVPSAPATAQLDTATAYLGNSGGRKKAQKTQKEVKNKSINRRKQG